MRLPEYLRRVLVPCLTGEKWGRSWQRRGRYRRSWRAPDSAHECLNKTRNISQVNKLHRCLRVACGESQVADTGCAPWHASGIDQEAARRAASPWSVGVLRPVHPQRESSSRLRESARLPLTVRGLPAKAITQEKISSNGPYCRITWDSPLCPIRPSTVQANTVVPCPAACTALWAARAMAIHTALARADGAARRPPGKRTGRRHSATGSRSPIPSSRTSCNVSVPISTYAWSR